jgi:hypothetical protein
MMEPCKLLHHVVRDTFAEVNARPEDGKYVRIVPGDCWCIKCQQAVPFWFNDGKPIEVVEVKPVAIAAP